MLPSAWQKLFRALRAGLGISCLFNELVSSHFAFTQNGVLFAGYTVYALVALLWKGLEDAGYAVLALAVDTLFFFLILTSPAPYSYWISTLFFGYLLAVSVVSHDWRKALAITASSIAFINFLQPVHGSLLLPGLISAGILGSTLAIEHAFLKSQASMAARQSVMHRYEAEKAREAERQRIAADFHDGPLQSFIGFQMRLEIIRKIQARDPGGALEELDQLQRLSKDQVNELRAFVRSMRPVDIEGSLNFAIRRVVDQFQKDSGISASIATADFVEPAEPETSLELLQIIREALYNVQKHASATRVAVSVMRTGNVLEVLIEDNGQGFPFSGRYTLEELELMRLGPTSIMRRVRTLGAEMTIESKPGQGVGLRIRLAT